MRGIRLCVWALVLAMAVAAAGRSGAQDALRIAAVVNDKVISVYDLNMRIKLVMMFSGMSDSVETRRRLGPQVLQTLIDDELKRQEAARQGTIVSDDEIAGQLRRLEEINRLSDGQIVSMIARNGIDRTALDNRIRADIAWSKLIAARFGRRFRVTNEEIDEVVAEIQGNKGKPEYLLAEIFLPVNQAQDAPEVLALATKLVQQMRTGTEFSALARNFSRNPSAARNGDLGWVRAAQLEPEVAAAVARLQPGQVTPPIRTDDGYYLMLLRNQRTAKGLDDAPDDISPVVNLQQFFIPVEKGTAPAMIADIMDAARKGAAKAKNCVELDAEAKLIGSPLSGNLGDIRLDALAPQQRDLVRGLPPLKASEPLRTDDGVVVLMVCRRDEPKKAAVSFQERREQIADRLMGERLNLAARQHLRDIRRTAFIDVRL